MIKQEKLIHIVNPVQVDFIDFNPDIISTGFKYGEIAADKFALKYLASTVRKKKHLRLRK